MGYTKRNNDGGASTPKLAERDERAAEIRRSKRAAKSARAKSGNGGTATTLFDDIRKDRHTTTAQQTHRVVTEFQLRQAIAALDSPVVTELKDIAFVVAKTMIQAFPDARADKAGDRSKTRVAFDLAVAGLTPKQRARKGAIDLGRRKATQALNEAYISLST